MSENKQTPEIKEVKVSKLKLKIPSVDELLEAGVHFGHQARRWHPKMDPYIFDKQKDIHVIDLYKTHELLEQACQFLYETAAKGGQIIFVGTKKQASLLTEEEAHRSGALFVNDRWVGGTITNFQTIRKNIEKLKNYLKRRENNELAKYTKKERLLIDREIEKLQRTFGGIVPLTTRPATLVVVDIKREKTAVREAKLLKIPVVGLVDTNSDPADITYVVPGNDDGIRSITLIMKTFADAVLAGFEEYATVVKKASDASEKAKNKDEAVDELPKVEVEELIEAKPALKEVIKEEVTGEVKAKKEKIVAEPKTDKKPKAKKVAKK